VSTGTVTVYEPMSTAAPVSRKTNDKANAHAAARHLLAQIEQLHRAEFTPAERLIVPAPQLPEFPEFLATAEKQALLDTPWTALLDNEPAIVTATVSHAYAATQAPARMVAVVGGVGFVQAQGPSEVVAPGLTEVRLLVMRPGVPEQPLLAVTIGRERLASADFSLRAGQPDVVGGRCWTGSRVEPTTKEVSR